MWALLSDEQKQTYGEEYFEQALRSLEKYTNVVIVKSCQPNEEHFLKIIYLLQDADILPAVRALIDACIRTFPLPRYTPVTRAEKIQTIIAEHFPRSVYDVFYAN